MLTNPLFIDDNWQSQIHVPFDLPNADIRISEEVSSVNVKFVQLLNTPITDENKDELISGASHITSVLAQLCADIESFGQSVDEFSAHVRNVSYQLSCDKEEFEYKQNSLLV